MAHIDRTPGGSYPTGTPAARPQGRTVSHSLHDPANVELGYDYDRVVIPSSMRSRDEDLTDEDVEFLAKLGLAFTIVVGGIILAIRRGMRQ